MTDSKVTYETRLIKAILNLKDRKGASRPAIRSYVEENYGEVNASALRGAIRKAVDNGKVLQEGQRFKLSDAAKAAAKRKTKPKAKAKAKGKGSAYKTIKGVKYDKGILDAAAAATAGDHDYVISATEAKTILAEALDGNLYTQIEKDTMAYIRSEYKWTKAADTYTRNAVKKWALKKVQKKSAAAQKKRKAASKKALAAKKKKRATKKN